jgi:pyridoxal phosphate enzyme (YggS family)
MDRQALVATLHENLIRVRQRMAASCRRADRDPGGVALLPATKYATCAVMEAFMTLGVREFGENQVKAAEEKARRLGSDAVFHMIGHLQRNKAKRAVALFRTVQSVDSVRLAEEIARRAAGRGAPMPVLLEANLGGEAAKYGFAEAEILSALERISRLPELRVEGFMTVPPYTEDPEEARPYFRRLREIRDEARRRGLGDGTLAVMSMGMSNDFTVAIEEGATVVRIGSALFTGIEGG